jgi:hypothetical protein
MAGTLEFKDNGPWFSVDDRRYHALSPVHLNRKAHLVLMLAVYNGQGDDCLYQDEVDVSLAKSRKAFEQALQCLHGWDPMATEADLLDLDREARKAIEQEAACRKQVSQASPSIPRCGNVEEGVYAYFRLRTEPDGAVVRTPITSFVVEPKLRVWIDGSEAIQADLKTLARTFPDVTLERHHWHSRGLFLKALPALDLWCVASDNEVQCIQAIMADKQVPRKQGTRALGYQEGLWVTEEGVLGTEGWMTDPPIVYLPHGGESPLAGRLQYRKFDRDTKQEVTTQFYQKLWHL